MIKFFSNLRSSIFGMVVSIWGLILAYSPAFTIEETTALLALTVDQLFLGWFFIVVGLLFTIVKMLELSIHLQAFVNILLALAFVIVMLTNLFASIYVIAWIAFAAVAINRIIDTYLLYLSK